jgi:hypothetical protein
MPIEMIAIVEHPSLQQYVIDCGCKKFYDIGPWIKLDYKLDLMMLDYK